MTGLVLTAGVAQGKDYIVGENDVLEVSVYDHPDLTSTVRVSGDGSVILPLLGQIDVAGLSIRELEKKIEDLLSDGYILTPLVTVFVKEFRGRKVTILGEVHQSGLYQLTGSASLLEIISKAGGLTDSAGDRAILKRSSEPGNGEKPSEQDTVLTIDLKRLVQEGDMSLNIDVRDGDSIYITRAGHFFVTGEVEKPGSYIYQEGMTVLKAITTAGGFTDKAAKGRVRMIRTIDGKDTSRKVGPDEKVLPDDVIDVPESFF